MKFLKTKKCKKVFYKCGTRTVPSGLTRTHVGAYVARRTRTKLIGPMSIVGLGVMIRRGALGLGPFPLIYEIISIDFFGVRLLFFVCAHATWQLKKRWIKARERVRIDLVTNLHPSISLVKSNGCDLFSHSVNRRVTRDCLWRL